MPLLVALWIVFLLFIIVLLVWEADINLSVDERFAAFLDRIAKKTLREECLFVDHCFGYHSFSRILFSRFSGGEDDGDGGGENCFSVVS